LASTSVAQVELRAAQHRPIEACAAQSRVAQIGVFQLHLAQIGVGQIETRQVDAGQIATGEQHAGAMPLLDLPAEPAREVGRQRTVGIGVAQARAARGASLRGLCGECGVELRDAGAFWCGSGGRNRGRCVAARRCETHHGIERHEVDGRDADPRPGGFTARGGVGRGGGYAGRQFG
jgi:hypothetical protein